jgi:hypothetical protein
MAVFKERAGTKSAVRQLKNPFPDLAAFDAVVRELIQKNPLGCTSYMMGRKNHPPVSKVREMYTAKFVYKSPGGKRIGTGQDMYNSVEGYETGVAAIISNMANLAAHGGKARHLPDADLFSVTLKCNDPERGFYFISIARDRMTVSSYTDNAILARVSQWAAGVPALA